MTIPNYLVRIKGKEFDCSGSQLAAILEAIKENIRNPIWYACDINTNEGYLHKKGLESSFPLKIGNTDDLILLSQSADQFLSGVFLAFEKDVGERIPTQYETEDKEFREIGDAFLEIRAFDTSYFAIYTLNYELIRKIARGFYGIVEYNLETKKDYYISQE